MNEKEAQEALKEYRKLVKDHIKGNIPFHEDGWGKKQDSVPEKQEEKQEQEYIPHGWEGVLF